jgi:flagellar biosynthesis protein FlhA
MTREQVERLLERARGTTPALVEEVVPSLLRAGELQRVLQYLLRERVSVRDLETILETLAVHAGTVKDTDALTEHVRRGLGRRITEQYRGGDGRLRVVGLSREVDARLAAAGVRSDTRPAAALGADTSRGLLRAVAMAVAPLIESGQPPIVLASAGARPVLKDLTRADLPRLVVLSQREIPRDAPVEIVGTVVEDDPADALRAAVAELETHAAADRA